MNISILVAYDVIQWKMLHAKNFILFRIPYSQHSSYDCSICLKKKILLVSGTNKTHSFPKPSGLNPFKH